MNAFKEGERKNSESGIAHHLLHPKGEEEEEGLPLFGNSSHGTSKPTRSGFFSFSSNAERKSRNVPGLSFHV